MFEQLWVTLYRKTVPCIFSVSEMAQVSSVWYTKTWVRCSRLDGSVIPALGREWKGKTMVRCSSWSQIWGPLAILVLLLWVQGDGGGSTTVRGSRLCKGSLLTVHWDLSRWHLTCQLLQLRHSSSQLVLGGWLFGLCLRSVLLHLVALNWISISLNLSSTVPLPLESMLTCLLP